MNDQPVDQSSTRRAMEPRFHAPGDLASNNVSTVGAKATVTAPAGVNGEKYVLTAFSFRMATNTQLSAGTIGCNVIDGATGTAAFLWQEAIAATTTGAECYRSGLNIVGTANTALTIEFSAGVASATQSVNMTYHKLGGVGQ